jgi:hypothetical protein
MDRQHRVSRLFGVFVRLIGAARIVRGSAPLVAGLCVAAAGFASMILPDGRVGAFAPEGHAADAGQGYTLGGLPFNLRFGEAPSAPASVGPTLSREQQNLAEFIARTYRVAAWQTQWFVEHAYRAARELKLDPMLILAVISVESSFDPQAQSHRGAQGLMQVLTQVHADKFSPFGGVAAAFDPLANIRVGAQILSEYLRRAGSVEGALKAYVGAALLPHDGGYGAKVIFERERMAAAAAGRPVPAPRALPVPADAPRLGRALADAPAPGWQAAAALTSSSEAADIAAALIRSPD